MPESRRERGWKSNRTTKTSLATCENVKFNVDDDNVRFNIDKNKDRLVLDNQFDPDLDNEVNGPFNVDGEDDGEFDLVDQFDSDINFDASMTDLDPTGRIIDLDLDFEPN